MSEFSIIYYRFWNGHANKPANLITQDEALIFHNSRSEYVAILTYRGNNICFIHCNMKWIGVGFLDDMQRVYLHYSFQEKEASILFLSSAYTVSYLGNNSTANSGSVYYFNVNGCVSAVDYDNGTNERREYESTFDPSANWEPYPAFGKYEGVTRKERFPN